MSTSEYHDLFLKCQGTGKYHMFSFDIVESRKMSTEKRKEASEKMMKLMFSMYSELEELEKTLNRKILVFEEGFARFNDKDKPRGFGVKYEPIVEGDAFCFTIYRDSVDRETVYKIYEYYKKLYEIDFDFHLSDGFYETNDYGRGGEEYFRGYCFDVLSNFHKPYIQEEIAKAQKKLKK